MTVSWPRLVPKHARLRHAWPRHAWLKLGWLLLAVTICVLAMGCGGPDARARRVIEAGDRAARQSALREALGHYREAVAAEPGSIQAQTRRGAMAEVLGQFDEALEAYGRAAQLQPSALAHYRAGAMAERVGNTGLAAEYLTASLSAPLTRWERAAQRGARWIEGTSAGLRGSRVARMLPDWVPQSLALGRAVLANAVMDREVVAGLLFTTLLEGGETARALDLAQSRGWVWEGADYCAVGRGRGMTETRALVGMLVAPERTDCLLPVGRSLTDSGLVGLSRAVLLDRVKHSGDPRIRQEAAAFLRMRLPAHDVSKLAESLNIAGYNLQHRFRDPGAAAEVYQRAIAADPRFSWPYANLGRLYMDMDQPEVALDWLRAAVRVNPDHFRAQANLGAVLQTLKRYDEAVPVFRTALELDPDAALVHANLGRSLMNLGQEGEGVRELQVAIRLDPSLTDEREILNRRLGSDPRGGPTPFAAR